MCYKFTGAIVCARKNVRLHGIHLTGEKFKSMNFKCPAGAIAVRAALNVVERRKGVHETRGASCSPYHETSDKPLSVHLECKFCVVLSQYQCMYSYRTHVIVRTVYNRARDKRRVVIRCRAVGCINLCV